MSKPLVVVESPAKAKTLSKFLGSDYDVRASVGHVSDLPSKGLNIDVDNGFKPTYELTERGKTVVKDLRAALKDASELYLATDEDREGEAISWHLIEYLKPKVPVKRMVFHEITKAAVDHAVNNPRDLDYGLVDAAETRRILEKIPPLAWDDVADLFLADARVEVTVDEERFADVPDAEDRKFAALALEAGAILVSSDRHLLDHVEGVEVRPPGRWWRDGRD